MLKVCFGVLSCVVLCIFRVVTRGTIRLVRQTLVFQLNSSIVSIVCSLLP